MNKENWKYLSIGDCATVVGGGTPSTKNPEYWDGDISWISPKDLSTNTNKYISRGERFITKKGLENSSAKILPENSLLFSSRAPIGYLAINTQPMATNQGFKSLILKDEFDVEFFYYLFKQKTEYIKNFSSGSTFQEISGSEVKNLKFLIPPYKEQKQIAKILSKLDKKIELNQKMNATLEEITKTLFKSWFIDFDPVKAKAEGRPTGLSKEIGDLFPDSFEDSELGDIPKGWNAGSLNDIIFRSKDKIKDTKSKVLAAVSSGELVLSEEYFSKQVFSKDTSKYLKVEQYDFAYNPSRINIGSIGMNEDDIIGAVSPVYIVFKPLKNWHPYINEFIKLKSTNSKINQLSSGSVRQTLSFDNFASIPIVKPTDLLNMKFNEIYESLRSKIIQNLEECEILTSMRDSLLPKLMSGELQIPDAENLIEEADI